MLNSTCFVCKEQHEYTIEKHLELSALKKNKDKPEMEKVKEVVEMTEDIIELKKEIVELQTQVKISTENDQEKEFVDLETPRPNDLNQLIEVSLELPVK